jgi:signal transduction histidine kinase
MRSRTTAGFVLIIAVVLACCITTLISFARNSGEYENRELLQSIADEGREALQHPDWQARLDKIAAESRVADKNISIAVVHRNRPNGRFRRDGQGDGTGGTGDRPTRTSDSRPGGPDPQMAIMWQSRKVMPPNRPRPDGSGRTSPEQKAWDASWRGYAEGAGDGRLVAVVRPFSNFLHEMDRRQMDMLLMGGLVVFVVGVGAWFVVGKTLSPIRRLANQAANATAEKLDTRLEPPSQDREVLELVNTLNGFLTRMEETVETKGRFYAAASHELRTPLQALSGHLELALSRERTAEDYKAALEEAKKQSSRLKSLVQSLLLLHQLESRTNQPSENIDLSAVCTATLEHFAPLLQSRDLKVRVNIPTSAHILAISNHAEILTRNLIENAAKYATAGGKVSVSVIAGAEETRLEVFDECEPIQNWSSESVFEAFYRPDAARNNKTGGNGLGLAICRAVAHANGWNLSVEQVENGFMAVLTCAAVPEAKNAPAKRRTREKIVGAPAVEL